MFYIGFMNFLNLGMIGHTLYCALHACLLNNCCIWCCLLKLKVSTRFLLYLLNTNHGVYGHFM